MSETINKDESNVEEVIIPTNLKTFLGDIADNRLNYKLSEPWKYNENALAVVVPILRQNAPEREYVTMYEVLKDLNIKDSGGISQVELQNKSGKAIFVRAGTIFTGSTQNRAAQHSGVYTGEEEKIKVCCVHASHGITRGSEMAFGDIAPPSVTMNLMTEDQSGVWNSVRGYTGGSSRMRRYGAMPHSGGFVSAGLMSMSDSEISNMSRSIGCSMSSTHAKSARKAGTHYLSSPIRMAMEETRENAGTDNLLGHLEGVRKGQSVIDDMMQKVPLFPDQVGAIIFNPVGLIAFETFDSPESWAAIKKEIIEKWGDRINEKQAEHLFELKPELILPKFRQFIEKLDNFTETTIKKDKFSETRAIKGEGVVGEYTLVKGQPVHVLLLKEENT